MDAVRPYVRAVLTGDLLARVLVVSLIVTELGRIDRPCVGTEGCDDHWGFSEALKVPLTLYLVWNILVILIDVAWFDRRASPGESTRLGLTVLGAFLRGSWLVPLTLAEPSWRSIACTTLTISSFVVAVLAGLRQAATLTT